MVVMGSGRAHTLLRVAFGKLESSSKVKRENRRLFREMANPDVLNLFYLAHQGSVEAAAASAAVPVPSLPGSQPALGDGLILEQLRKLFEWAIENQDAIAAFIKLLFDLFGSFA